MLGANDEGFVLPCYVTKTTFPFQLGLGLINGRSMPITALSASSHHSHPRACIAPGREPGRHGPVAWLQRLDNAVIGRCNGCTMGMPRDGRWATRFEIALHALTVLVRGSCDA